MCQKPYLPAMLLTVTAAGVDISADFTPGMIFLITGMADDSNNGIHVLTAVAFSVDTTLTFGASTFATETPGADFKMVLVGFEFAADDAGITNTGGNLPQLTSTADLTDLGLQLGENHIVPAAALMGQNALEGLAQLAFEL